MKNRSHILVVDDERLIRWSICTRLQQEDWVCQEAADLAQARSVLAQGPPALVLLDMRLPDGNGLDLLQELRDLRPELPVVIMTAHSTVESAVDAIKLGALDYVQKPFDLDQLVATVRRVLEDGRTHQENGPGKFGLESLIGGSPAMTSLKGLARRIARSNAPTVLILGETGTGKDLLARALHYESTRVDKPFVNITCTAMPDSLLDSELFGYEKGAFTDAKDRKYGIFELAHGGTAFLDEVGDMSPALQSKLLRVLEERRFRRIGGTEDIEVDVRVFAATHRDLAAAAEEGRFRQDLYYRLSAMPITIPPLRDRLEDVPALAHHFAAFAQSEGDRSSSKLSPETEDRLQSYAWPGNVRELRNVIERAVLLSADASILPDDLVLGRTDRELSTPSQQGHFKLPSEGIDLAELDRTMTSQALERAGWNQTKAAKLLHITRDQMRYRIEKYNLTPS